MTSAARGTEGRTARLGGSSRARVSSPARRRTRRRRASAAMRCRRSSARSLHARTPLRRTASRGASTTRSGSSRCTVRLPRVRRAVVDCERVEVLDRGEDQEAAARHHAPPPWLESRPARRSGSLSAQRSCRATGATALVDSPYGLPPPVLSRRPGCANFSRAPMISSTENERRSCRSVATCRSSLAGRSTGLGSPSLRQTQPALPLQGLIKSARLSGRANCYELSRRG